MRSLLPRIFASKSKQPATQGCEAADGSALEEGKTGKLWRFRIPCKKYRLRLAVETASSKRSRNALSTSRKTRKPTLTTTQRKLAASRKRLRSLQNQKSCKGTRPDGGTSRRTTYPSFEAVDCEKYNEWVDENSGVGSVRRSKTNSAFVLKGGEGGASIEVEFTDEGEDLATGCQKGTRFPVTIFSVEESQPEDIKVGWKGPPSSVTYPEFDDEKQIISQRVCNEQRFPEILSKQISKNLESAEWESVSGSVEEANAAWLEFNQEQMLARLAGMQIQQAPKSQDFTTRKPMRILPYTPQQSKIPSSKRTTSCINSPVVETERGRKLSCYC